MQISQINTDESSPLIAFGIVVGETHQEILPRVNILSTKPATVAGVARISISLDLLLLFGVLIWEGRKEYGIPFQSRLCNIMSCLWGISINVNMSFHGDVEWCPSCKSSARPLVNFLQLQILETVCLGVCLCGRKKEQHDKFSEHKFEFN